MPKPKAPLERNALASGPEHQPAGLQLKGRIWLEKDGHTFLSWGRVVLLERIAQHGTLAAAARSMDMSYSHAWKPGQANERAGRQALGAKAGWGQKGWRGQPDSGGGEGSGRFLALGQAVPGMGGATPRQIIPLLIFF